MSSSNAQVLYPYVGKFFRIVGLTSQKGLTMNGKVGKVVTTDPQGFRIGIKIEGDQTVYKLKLENIIDPLIELPNLNSERKKKQPLSQELIQNCIRVAKSQMGTIEKFTSIERRDVAVRARLMKELIRLYENGEFGYWLECRYFQRGENESNLISFITANKLKCIAQSRFKLSDIFDGDVSDEKAGARWREYALSGFCVQCQKAYIQFQGQQSSEQS